MKFYWRDPDAAFAGMAGMTLEQIGAYTLVLDRLYALDGVLPDNDAELARALHLDPRLWRRLKAELMSKGKIRVTTAGMLEANGVTNRLLLAKIRSTSAKHAADVRWTNYRKAHEINEPAMRARNASKTKNKKDTSTSVEAEQNQEGVDDGENFGVVVKPSTAGKDPAIPVSTELEAIAKAKGWTL